jgi:hypothetical protein
MEDIESAKQFFESMLNLLNFLDNQTMVIEDLLKDFNNEEMEKEVRDKFLRNLARIKKYSEFVKECMSKLAFLIAGENDDLQKVLDDIYLNQDKTVIEFK